MDRPDKDDPKKFIRIDGFLDDNDNPLKVPDFLFFQEKPTVIDLSVVCGDAKRKNEEARGLIHILSSYKFTIMENTPVEEEIALDPELLGKVFENLLASYNPETRITARRQTGSFYTPREIVNYMVDESLMAYLKLKLVGYHAELRETKTSESEIRHISENLCHLFSFSIEPHRFDPQEVDVLIQAIDCAKILDPACGSGAFPMGILHKMVHLLHKLDPNNEKWKQRQVTRVQNAIRETQQIDDVRIRANLLVDLQKNLNSIEDAFLHNELDYGRKLYLIQNCIFGVDIQPIAVQIAKLRFFISLIVNQKVDSEKDNLGICPLPNLETKFVAVNTLNGISRPTQMAFGSPEIDTKVDLLKKLRKQHFFTPSQKAKSEIRKMDTILREKIAELLTQFGSFGHEYATKIVKWDPYDQESSANFFDPEWMFNLNEAFDIVIGNPPYIKEYTFKSAFNEIRNSPYYQGKMDIWYFFACRSLDLSKRRIGILAFIATNNWVTNSGASKMREKVIRDTKIEKLIDFGSFMIFESSDIQTMIMMFRNDASINGYTFDYRKLIGSAITFDDILDLISHKPNPKAEYLAPAVYKEMLYGKPLVFSSLTNEKILSKIASKTNFKLDKKDEVAQGIVAPQDSVNKTSQKKLGRDFRVGDGIFYLSNAEKETIPFTSAELGIIKPLYTSCELEKYFGNPVKKYWVIYTNSSFKRIKKMKDFPNIKMHLDKYKSVITSVNGPYGLHRARKESFFQGEKIISKRKCTEPTFTYTDFDCYVSQTYFVIKSHRIDLRYLTGILNSRLIAFWLRHKGKMQGSNYQVDKDPILQIPIYKTTKQEPFVKVVEKILQLKKVGDDTSALEKRLDLMIYKLYGLTYDEVETIDPELSISREEYEQFGLESQPLSVGEPEPILVYQ